jgi:tetratricopeptide (TPR) repeat protein
MENPTPSPERSTKNPSDQRYWFFISYSHTDLGEAARVQRGIEGFRIPEALRGKSSRFGELPKRPVPVFRDRDALASSHDLTAEIQAALAASANLLVVCSQAAAQSRWVAREVEAFIQLHGREAVLCLVLDGEPNAADPSLECLPAPLRRDAFGHDILAADLRRGADGRRQALLKILAGGLGLSYGHLAGRERRRATRRMVAWMAASAVVTAGFGILAFNADLNRKKALQETRRANITSDYLTSVLLQFLPNESNGIPNAALLPLIEASASAEKLSPLKGEPLALIRIQNLLATAYLQLDQVGKAIDLYGKNLILAESAFGPEDPRTLEVRFNVANASAKLGDLKRAEELYRSLLATILRKPGQFPEQRITIVCNLGSLVGNQNRRREAADLFEQNLDALDGYRPAADIVLQYRANYANQLLLLGEGQKAVEILTDVAGIFDQAFGPQQMNTLQAKHMLANALVGIGKIEEAGAIYREIQGPLKLKVGPTHSLSIANAFKLVALLHHTGRTAEACALSKEYFGSPPDAALVEKAAGPGEKLPDCP